jgi:hypothetical protein
MILHVVESKYVDGYRLWLRFNDGSSGVADLSDSLTGPVFEPLTNLELFKTARVDPELSTVVWANGADFAPEYLASKVDA